MSSLNLDVSEATRAFIEKQVADGRFASPSEYVEALVRSDRSGTFDEAIEARLLEGLASGDAVTADDAYWSRKRAALLERHGQSGGR